MSEHPKFDEFKRRRLENPAIRAAYEEAKARRDAADEGGALVEIGGEVMTRAQFDAARFPLLNPASDEVSHAPFSDEARWTPPDEEGDEG